MTRHSLVFGPSGALRAPWRLAAFAAIATVVWVMAAGLLAPLLAAGSEMLGLDGAVDGWVVVVALLAAHAIMLRGVDHLPWSSVWLGREAARPGAWISGGLIGSVAIAVPCLALLGAHELRIIPATQGSWLASAARVSWTLLPYALLEELLTRGYVFRVLFDVWGARAALVVTSVAFGLLHTTNPGATAQSVLVVTLAGVFLGAVLLSTGSLYAAWMAHFAWNWVQAVPLHSAVSGIPLESPNYQMVDAGPVWLTGGGWGPEGGVAAAAGMIVVLTYLHARRVRREES